ANGDGAVDGADFVIWQTNFPFPTGPGAAPVPEPCGLMLFGAGCVGLIVGLRKRRSAV
ncbi:MAG: PEP-CTERM sorting domain-containing protein, partial [Pirellulales bacterium]|nr:PEP-CTERM sorting domain-containing protein [Pirellulales bacterium]